ncbi:MAG: MarR family winged helix-turn-helix transcriptional regulator [Candidatus Wallbacteria bacterium]|nr:MarR family winged helix-turn-helix transcriptional regulator [Candidatus Wallbacteria bacterium]
MRSKHKIESGGTPLQKIQCACTNLKMAARVVGRAYDKALAVAGLNSTQYAILINVSRYQPIPQMRLTEHLDLERTTLYRAVDILEKKGYLKTTPTGEGMAKVIELSPQGEDITARAMHEWETLQQSFISSFGADKWAEFTEMLEAIRQHFRK